MIWGKYRFWLSMYSGVPELLPAFEQRFVIHVLHSAATNLKFGTALAEWKQHMTPTIQKPGGQYTYADPLLNTEYKKGLFSNYINDFAEREIFDFFIPPRCRADGLVQLEL